MNILPEKPTNLTPLQEILPDNQQKPPSLEEELVALAKDNQIDKLCKSCETAISAKKLNFAELLKILTPYGTNKHIQIILIALEKCKILQNQHTKLNTLEIFKTCLYIETKIANWKSQNQPVSETNATPVPLHFDPQLNGVVIELGKKKGKQIGKGESKTWTQSLIYKQNEVENVAYTVLASIKNKKEIEIIKTLDGQKGIARNHKFIEISAKADQKEHVGILQKFYKDGHLGEYLFGKKKLTEKQKEQVILGLLEGMTSMHAKGVRHNDFHMEQCLLELLPNTKVEACITDFDKAEKFTDKSPIQKKDFFLFDLENEDEKEESERTDEEQATLDRLRREVGQAAQKNPNVTHVRDDLYQMATLLKLLFFDENYCLDDLSAQAKRHALDDTMKKNRITLQKLPKKEQLEYVMLKLVAFPDQEAISAEEAHKALLSILTS